MGNVGPKEGDPDRESEEYLDSANVALMGYLCSAGKDIYFFLFIFVKQL